MRLHSTRMNNIKKVSSSFLLNQCSLFHILVTPMDNSSTISGFTFIRNAVKFDYPVVEAITSILPICDEFIANVGNSDDDTLSLITSIGSEKIKIVESVWDEKLRIGGQVLAQQTDIAFSHCIGNWCFYIQADEVVHEQYLPSIREATQRYHSDQLVEGLLFNYLHFYGSYDYVGSTRQWYRNEIRVIRNNKNIISHKDAQGFRIDGRRLKVKPLDAYVYHYGWVKSPQKQQSKQRWFNLLWHSDEWLDNNVKDDSEFDYSAIDSLRPFTGDHPSVMKNRITQQDWDFTFNQSANLKHTPLKHRILNKIESVSGYRFGEYKSYKLLK